MRITRKMSGKKGFAAFVLALTLLSLASAEPTIIFNSQPKEIYNFGDIINLPITLKTTTNIYGIFEVELICNGAEISFYKNGVSLKAGEEKKLEPTIVLMRELIPSSKGTCKIKAKIGETYKLTDEFEISDLINLELSKQPTEVAPEEALEIQGTAIKENGQPSNGFIELSIDEKNETQVYQLETIQNGFFSIKFAFPKNTKAGMHLIKLNAYETDPEGNKINKGFLNYNIKVKQIPSDLEIFFENKEVEPGTSAKIKAILHDQTGEKIKNATAKISIYDEQGKLVEQREIPVDTFLEYPFKYNEPPAEFSVSAESEGLTTKAKFELIEKEDIKVQVINRTVSIKNVGNVDYCNKTVLIKIGNESVNVDVCLKVDEEKKYILSAPDGEYVVRIVTEEGTKFNKTLILTGKSIEVKEAKGVIGKTKYYLAWLFIIAILATATWIIFKKGYNRKVLTHLPVIRKKRPAAGSPTIKHGKKPSQLGSSNRAELSLSIKGDKQEVSIICLKLKNHLSLEKLQASVKEVLQKIVAIAEENKACTYESHSNLFFIFAPVKTKTFQNEKIALKVAEKIKSILESYNRMAKEKIDFGISLNHGTMVIHPVGSSIQFTSLGNLMSIAKKIATISKGEILLSEKTKEKLHTKVKAEKETKESITYFKIKEIKNLDESHENFLKAFVKRMESQKSEKSSSNSKSSHHKENS